MAYQLERMHPWQGSPAAPHAASETQAHRHSVTQHRTPCKIVSPQCGVMPERHRELRGGVQAARVAEAAGFQQHQRNPTFVCATLLPGNQHSALRCEPQGRAEASKVSDRV